MEFSIKIGCAGLQMAHFWHANIAATVIRICVVNREQELQV